MYRALVIGLLAGSGAALVRVHLPGTPDAFANSISTWLLLPFLVGAFTASVPRAVARDPRATRRVLRRRGAERARHDGGARRGVDRVRGGRRRGVRRRGPGVAHGRPGDRSARCSWSRACSTPAGAGWWSGSRSWRPVRGRELAGERHVQLRALQGETVIPTAVLCLAYRRWPLEGGPRRHLPALALELALVARVRGGALECAGRYRRVPPRNLGWPARRPLLGGAS